MVLCLLLLATGFMLLTLLPRLHITNLQIISLQRDDFIAAAKEQLTLYPEYLLPALLPPAKTKHHHPLLRLAAAALWFDVGMHLVLELFYGAAMPLRVDPIHGRSPDAVPLSIFNRLESLQLILWIMAITLKLSLYLYAICLLLRRGEHKGLSVSLRNFPLYLGCLWLLCALLQKIDVSLRYAATQYPDMGPCPAGEEWEVSLHGFAKN